MATTGRSTVSAEHDAAAVLSDAEFVRVTAAASGGSVAAAAMLAAACGERDVPYQVRVARSAPVLADESASQIVVGVNAEGADAAFVADAPNAVFEELQAAGAEPDPVLAFAGALADGVEPSSAVRDAADLNRRPGVGVPTADLTAGIASTTRIHGSFSGDEQAAGATLAELDLPPEMDDDAHRKLASVVALDATEDATEQSVGAVADALRPHELSGGLFETVEGYADVLSALAWDAPGLAVALALGSSGRHAAVEAWQDHASSAHEAVRVADPTRHQGVVVVDASEAHPTVARLVRDYRATEPAALVVGDGVAALATTDANALETLPNGVGTSTLAVTELGGETATDEAAAEGRTDTEDEDVLDEDAIVEAVRGAL